MDVFSLGGNSFCFWAARRPLLIILCWLVLGWARQHGAVGSAVRPQSLSCLLLRFPVHDVLSGLSCQDLTSELEGWAAFIGGSVFPTAVYAVGLFLAV